MNRLEREVLAELEAEYEFDDDRAVAIVALVREAVLQEIEDAKPDVPEYSTVNLIDYSSQTPTTLYSTYTTNNTGAHAQFNSSMIKQTVNNLRKPPTLNIANMPKIVISVDHFRHSVEVTCECGDRSTVPLELWQTNQEVRQTVESYVNHHLRLQHSVMGNPFKLPS